MKIKLESIDPFAPALDLEIDRLRVVIGRDGKSDLAVNDRWTSEQHCELSQTNGVLTVRDLSSRHGTLLNGQSVDEAKLQAGDTLTIGIRTFRLSYLEPASNTIAKAKAPTRRKRGTKPRASAAS